MNAPIDKKPINYSSSPWKESITEDGDFSIEMDDAHSVLIGNLEGTCEICHGNAKLIEKAPELYELLAEWLDDGRFLSANTPEKNDLVERTKNVINSVRVK